MLHNSKTKLKLINRPCVCNWTFTMVKLSFELSAFFFVQEIKSLALSGIQFT